MATRATTKTRKSPSKSSSAGVTRSSVKSAPAKTSNNFVGEVKKSLRTVALWRALAAEFIGTFLLAAVIITGQGQPIIVMFALVGIVLLLGALSGAHVNPAITIGALVTRRITWIRALGYVIVQCLGAALAFVTLGAFLAAAGPVSEEAQLFGQTAPALFSAVEIASVAGKEWFVFFAELLGTAILGVAIASTIRSFKNNDRVAGAFTAGIGIFIALMVAISAASYAGASSIINPAVAIALQAYDWNAIWSFVAYALAPVIGGVAGFVLYDIVWGRAKN